MHRAPWRGVRLRGVHHMFGRVKLRSVHHTAESRKQNIYLKKKLRGVHPIRSQTPRCASHRRVMLLKFLKKLCDVPVQEL